MTPQILLFSVFEKIHPIHTIQYDSCVQVSQLFSDWPNLNTQKQEAVS